MAFLVYTTTRGQQNRHGRSLFLTINARNRGRLLIGHLEDKDVARLNIGYLNSRGMNDDGYMKCKGMILACAVAFFMAGYSDCCVAQAAQEHVHSMSHTVMPFDVSKTVHIFRMTESGGTQRVIAKEPSDTTQVEQIRSHLRDEAARFQRGDFSDPAKLHGAEMPGLKDLQAGAPRVTVAYSDLPDGAQIAFRTTDLHLLTAIHRWFGAQLSEHGADARAE